MVMRSNLFKALLTMGLFTVGYSSAYAQEKAPGDAVIECPGYHCQYGNNSRGYYHGQRYYQGQRYSQNAVRNVNMRRNSDERNWGYHHGRGYGRSRGHARWSGGCPYGRW